MAMLKTQVCEICQDCDNSCKKFTLMYENERLNNEHNNMFDGQEYVFNATTWHNNRKLIN